MNDEAKPDTAPACAKCKSPSLSLLKPGSAYFVTPKDRMRGLLRVGTDAPAWQCVACGDISGDMEFVEMNRTQRRLMEKRRKAGK